MSKNRPDDPSILCGQGNVRLVIAAAHDEIRRPPAETCGLAAGRMLHGGSSSLDQQSSKVIIATFGYASQSSLAARRVLLRRQAQPGRKLASILEVARTAEGGDHPERGNG